MATNTVTRPRIVDHRTESNERPPVVRDRRTTTTRPVPPPVVHHHHHHHHYDQAVTVRDHRDNRAVARGEFDSIFSRNDLSLEDKIMLLLFNVMAKMDKEITNKGKQISDAKSETPSTENGGRPTTNPDSAANGKTSLDQQTLELQQLVSRRNNLFQTLNAIVNKFDESAQNVIRKLGQG